MKKERHLLSALATAYSLQPTACSLLVLLVTLSFAAHAQQQTAATSPAAHFHHVHLNATDPAAAIQFYTSKFKARKESFAGLADAVWTGDSWLLFTKVAEPPPSELLSGIWHIGWGAQDMQSTYQQQLAMGTRFATPITDISDMVGGNRQFFYAYVDGPDHALIELNTARHHNFGHVHLFSADPPAAGAWYAKHFGFRSLPRTEKRVYRDVQIAPAAFVTADHVSMIIYPVEYRGGGFVSTRGRVIDHLGFSVDDLDAALARMRNDGVKVTAEPRSLADGRIRFAFVEGPDQVAIELIQDATPRPAPVTQ
jgi:catechol 2,3-dioxygenase-like lactoylglutathione lyase family enzyme